MEKSERERKTALYITVLRNGNFVNRLRSAKFLGEIGSEKAVDPLIKALKDGNWEMRERVVEALGENW